MATFNKFNSFVKDLAEKKHDLSADTLKIMLTNTAPVAANSYYSDISANELASGNGYTTGGNAAALSTSSQTSGTYCLVLSDPTTWTATGAMGPFRYAVLYNSTPATAATKGLIGWWDYASSVTLALNETFKVDLDQTAGVGVLTLA